MVLRRDSYFDDGPRGSDTLKDSRLKMVMVGHVIPVCILGVVLANLISGVAYLPAGRWANAVYGLAISYTYGWPFAGIMITKVGFAGAIYAWYGLANIARAERWVQPLLLASVIVAGVGILVHISGVLVL